MAPDGTVAQAAEGARSPWPDGSAGVARPPNEAPANKNATKPRQTKRAPRGPFVCRDSRAAQPREVFLFFLPGFFATATVLATAAAATAGAAVGAGPASA